MDIKKIIIIVGLIIFSFVLTGCFKKKIDIKNTKRFSFSYTVGNYMYGSYLYELKLDKNGKYIISYKPDGVSDEEILQKEISKEDVKLLENVISKYNIYLWNGYNKVDKHVLDGNSFNLIYETKGNDYISASGYMKYPKGYKEFKEDIHNYYVNLFKEELD